MATTIYGCVTWATGEITFANLEDCLAQSSCVIFDGGAHDGQVALTLSDADNEDCNDTFYGCVNWTTGKFQVVIPDDCCIPSTCPECCDYIDDNYTVEFLVPNSSPPDWLTLSRTDATCVWTGLYGSYVEFCYTNDVQKVRLNYILLNGCTYTGVDCPLSGSCTADPGAQHLEYRCV